MNEREEKCLELDYVDRRRESHIADDERRVMSSVVCVCLCVCVEPFRRSPFSSVVLELSTKLVTHHHYIRYIANLLSLVYLWWNKASNTKLGSSMFIWHPLLTNDCHVIVFTFSTNQSTNQPAYNRHRFKINLICVLIIYLSSILQIGNHQLYFFI